MIIGEIRRYLRDNSAIRVSRSMRDTAYKALQMKEKLTNDTQQRAIRRRDCQSAWDQARGRPSSRLTRSPTPVSLYEPLYTDGGESICVMDQVSDTKNTDENWLEQIALGDAISRLSDREKHILALRFFYGKTQMEVARRGRHLTGAGVAAREKRDQSD